MTLADPFHSQPPTSHTLNRIDFKILHALTHGTGVQTLRDYLLPIFREGTPDITTTAALKRTQRHLAKLRAAGLVEVMNPGEKPHILRATAHALDLFSSARNSNSGKNSPFDLPNRCSQERKDSIKLLQSLKQMSKHTNEQICSNFSEYLDDIKEKYIVMKKVVHGQQILKEESDYLFIPYQTRFNNPEHHAKNLHIYDNVWDNATERYKRAVHLVLTTDPKRFKNLWEANRNFNIALNRFFSYLTKHFKHRPKYLVAYEYTGSGLIHCHLIIFGVPYLLPHKVITAVWERCGQGSYNYIYSLQNNNGDWLYARKKPKDIPQGQTARDYLQKYLKKGTEQPERVFMYWAFNKHFFTYSQALYTDQWPRPVSLGIYKFLMVCYDWDTPDITLENTPQFKEKPPPWDLSFPPFQNG